MQGIVVFTILAILVAPALLANEAWEALPTEAEVEAELFGEVDPSFSGLLATDSLCHPDLLDLLDPELALEDKPTTLIVQLSEFGEPPSTALNLEFGDWAEGFGQGVTASIELAPKFLFLFIHQLRYNLDGEDLEAFVEDPWQNGALPLLQAQHQATLGMWCEGREHNHPEMMGMATGNIAMNLVFMKGGYDLSKQMLMKRFSGTGASRVSGGLLTRLLQPGLRGSHLGMQAVLIDVIPIQTITPIAIEGASLGAAAALPGMGIVVYHDTPGAGGDDTWPDQEAIRNLQPGDKIVANVPVVGRRTGTVEAKGYSVTWKTGRGNETTGAFISQEQAAAQATGRLRISNKDGTPGASLPQWPDKPDLGKLTLGYLDGETTRPVTRIRPSVRVKTDSHQGRLSDASISVDPSNITEIK